MEKTISQRLEKKLKTKEKKGKKRKHKGFKANLVATNDSFSLNVPIRYKKLSSEDIDEENNIERLQISTKKKVKRKLDFRGYFNEDSVKVEKSDMAYYQLQDNEWIPVEKYPKSEVFEIVKYVKKDKLWNFLPEKYYELFPEENGLWILADYLQENELIGIIPNVVLRKSFKQYYGLLMPIVEDGKYTFILVLTRKNLYYENLKTAKMFRPKETEEKKAKPKTGLDLVI